MNIEKFQDDEFYYERTTLKDRESKKRWARRLLSLDLTAQKKISEKYYGGTMPWKETGK
ncbi:MAG: hypothetical protein ACYCWE_03675 [Eubacteriales bacterium]